MRLMIFGPSRCRCALSAAISLLAWSFGRAEEPAPAEGPPVWRSVSRLQWQDLPVEPTTRSEQLAQALVWLAGPKRSGANDSRALVRLEQLGAGDDEVAYAARYHAARYQLLKGDAAAGRRALEMLRAEPAAGRAGELAALKLATLELSTATDRTVRDLMAVHEPQLARVRDPAVRRNLHLLLGETYLRFEYELARAREHLQAATGLGLQSYNARTNTAFRLGVLAERLGDQAAAAAAYAGFAAEFPHDTRATLAREKAMKLGRGDR